MKRIILLTVAAIVISSAAFSQIKSVITELITYKVNLRLDEDLNASTFTDPSAMYGQMNEYWYQNKLAPTAYPTLVKNVHDAARAGKIKVYELYEVSGKKPVFMSLTNNEVLNIGADTLSKTMQRPYPPYEAFDTTIVMSFDYNEIVQIEFMEKWTTNTKTMEIKKDIIAYAIWRKRSDAMTGEFRGLSRMYWVKVK